MTQWHAVSANLWKKQFESQDLANIDDITAFRHPKYFSREGVFFLQEWVEERLLGECVEVKAEPGEGGRMAIEKLGRLPRITT
jgi:hypothetical protein